MNAAPLHLAGERLMLDPAGALYWPAREMLVVSDLHLEKGSSFARRGTLLPPWDTRATIDRLMVLLRHWRPRVLVALGDSFHDEGGVGRLPAAEAARLCVIAAGLRLIWVRGNHDPTPLEGLGGESVAALEEGGLVFRHQAEARAEPGEVSGHFHPKIAVPA
ncbi:MAG: ligase-associated DNA damage response endonuclease PdeM, partial [Acetobacteraceae bacterium]